VGLNSVWLWLTSIYSTSNDRKSPAKSQPLDRSPMRVTDNFIELLEGDPPVGAEVHTLLRRPHWRPDNLGDYRTIKVTRTDGSTWLCRAVLPVGLKVPITDIVSPMPNGHSFCTGYYVVDRDDPNRSDWIVEPLGIKWSETRDLVFFYDQVRIAAFGHGGLLWKHDLPGADPDSLILFDYISDKGAFHCTAEQRDKDADGNSVFAIYVIDTSGNISRQLEES
jgi:hypothetical protein